MANIVATTFPVYDWTREVLGDRLAETDLAALDPANAATYRANADAYCAKLAALDREYAATVSGAKRKTILVADRFPFRYLADDYGLTYFAAFSGCSAESEASFKTVAFLAKKVDELQLPAILVIEGTKHKIAETVKSTTKAKDAMERLGVAALAKRCYCELSGGQRQRVLLARALCGDCRLLLLDEPTTGLDRDATADFYRLLCEINAAGMTIATVTHDHSAALASATHVLTLGPDASFRRIECHG